MLTHATAKLCMLVGSLQKQHLPIVGFSGFVICAGSNANGNKDLRPCGYTKMPWHSTPVYIVYHSHSHKELFMQSVSKIKLSLMTVPTTHQHLFPSNCNVGKYHLPVTTNTIWQIPALWFCYKD